MLYALFRYPYGLQSLARFFFKVAFLKTLQGAEKWRIIHLGFYPNVGIRVKRGDIYLPYAFSLKITK